MHGVVFVFIRKSVFYIVIMVKNNPVVVLKPKREETLQRFHLWVFSGAIDRIVGNPQEGDVVDVVDSFGNVIAKGHYQIGSISVRVLSFNKDENIDSDFWLRKIELAYSIRKSLGLVSDNNNAYRLIHGEGDGLPGLVIDIYGDTAVLQAHSVGMHYAKTMIAESLMRAVDGLKNVYYKSEGTLPYKAPVSNENCYLVGSCPESCVAVENGLKFNVDWLRGQKTGFFIDQRENRSLLEFYAKGRDVLNMFCYTGGFSFYAMRGGAKSVCSVDSSAKAIDLTRKNVELNFPNDNRHKAVVDDAFKYLDDIKNRYDLIVLDPPAFAKHRDVLKKALIGYRKLNAKAFEQIRPNGILFTFSCSQVVTKEQFRLAVMSAAVQSKRNVRILYQLTQPADHPINIYHPESEYLKGLVLWVE